MCDRDDDFEPLPMPRDPNGDGNEPADEPPSPTEADMVAKRILNSIGYCGHYMHFHGGGTSGKAPIICLLAKHGGKMSQLELSTYFDLKPGSLSEILSKIERKGLIERTRNPEDRRQLLIKLTDAGVEAAAKDQAARIWFREKAFAALTPEEQLQLADMLERIRETWEGLDD